MASWGDAKLFLCFLFITCCCTVTLAQVPMDCCLTVTNKPIDKIVVVDYHKQISGHGCSITATIFVTRRGRKLCAPADQPWTQVVMNHVESRRQHCKKHPQKCKSNNGVKRG